MPSTYKSHLQRNVSGPPRATRAQTSQNLLLPVKSLMKAHGAHRGKTPLGIANLGTAALRRLHTNNEQKPQMGR